MSDNDRALKRARVSDKDPGNPNPPAASTPGTGISNLLTPHHEFWLPDGNIILVAGGIGFRVYRGLIAAQSTVFGDMFAFSRTDTNEIFDGCPVIHLSDSPEDLVHLVRVLLPKTQRLYNRSELRPFNEVSALIRLAHKYHIEDVEHQALASLRDSVLSPDFDNWYKSSAMTSIANIDMIGVVNLARLTDTPSMLPGALYACTRLSPGELLQGLEHEDRTVEHLSVDDFQKCLEGQRALAVEATLLPTRIFASAPVVGCDTPVHCQAWCQRTLVAIMSSETLAAHRNALTSLRDAILTPGNPEGATNTTGVCGTCEKELLKRDRRERWNVWKRLPEIFGIKVEGWGVGGNGENENTAITDT